MYQLLGRGGWANVAPVEAATGVVEEARRQKMGECINFTLN